MNPKSYTRKLVTASNIGKICQRSNTYRDITASFDRTSWLAVCALRLP